MRNILVRLSSIRDARVISYCTREAFTLFPLRRRSFKQQVNSIEAIKIMIAKQIFERLLAEASTDEDAAL